MLLQTEEVFLNFLLFLIPFVFIWANLAVVPMIVLTVVVKLLQKSEVFLLVLVEIPQSVKVPPTVTLKPVVNFRDFLLSFSVSHFDSTGTVQVKSKVNTYM